MTDVNQTNTPNAQPEANPETPKQAQANETPNEQNTETRGKYGPCGAKYWHAQGKHCGDGKRRRKVLIGAVLIGLLGFMLGKGVAHHHEHWQPSSAQPSVNMSYEGRGQNLPLSLVLDGIEATPEQRAKAVNLLH